MTKFNGTTHKDNFKGGSGHDFFYFSSQDLSPTDKLSGAGGDDVLVLTNNLGGSWAHVTASQLSGLSSVEDMVLTSNSFGFELDFNNNFFKQNKVKQFGIIGTALTDVAQGLHVLASSVTNMSFKIAGTLGGEDVLKTGKGSDAFIYAEDSFNVEDSINAGGGNDTLVFVGAGQIHQVKDGHPFQDKDAHAYLADVKGIDNIVVTKLKKGESRQIEFGNLVGTSPYTGTGVVTITTNDNYGSHNKAAPIAGELIVSGEQLKASQILHVTGGKAGDLLTSGAGDDRMAGGDGSDVIVGNAGKDNLSGGDGNDTLVGGTGADVMTGGAGNDAFIISDAKFNASGQFYKDHIDGGAGKDILRFTATTGIHLSASELAKNSVSGIEAIVFDVAASNSIALTNAFIAKNHDSDGHLHIFDQLRSNPSSGTGLSVDASKVTNSKFGIDVTIEEDGKNVLKGGAGNDVFDFAGSPTQPGFSGLDIDDVVSGGKGKDKILVDHGESATLGTGVTGIETLQIVAGGKSAPSDTTTVNLSVKSAMTVDGRSLGASHILVVQGNAYPAGGGSAIDATGTLTLLGGAGNDTLIGGTANDVISGGGGNDVIYGRLGADKLTGGAGADSFVFADLTDSTVAPKGEDTITDFTQGQADKIFFLHSNSNPSFNFIGTNEFDHGAREVRYEIDGSKTLVQLDLNGDTNVDLQITLNGAIHLTLGDFLGVQ